MRKILISIRPQWVVKILNGEKTLEIRKTAPKCELPCEVYIYCTKGSSYLYELFNHRYSLSKVEPPNSLNGKVVAKFTLNKVDEIENDGLWETDKYFLERTCLSFGKLACYLSSKTGYAWHIDNLVPFDRPKELREFEFPNPSGIRYIGQRAIKGLPSEKRAPQSWCYCEVDE